MKTLLVVVCLFDLGICQKKLFPDVTDLFQTFNEDPFDIKDLQNQGVYVKNISIDVEKLDLDKFKTKFQLDKINNETIEFNDTRRFLWAGKAWQFRHATKMGVKIKCLDIMLEIIYMARHKLKQLESEKFFNPKDTSYRIAFLYRRLRRIWKKMTDIYNTMWNHRWSSKPAWGWMEPFLILHHKAAKKHVDFLYLWWVQVKLHEKYCEAHVHSALSFTNETLSDENITNILKSQIKANSSHITDDMMLDYVFGNDTDTYNTETIDTGLLEVDNLKEIVAVATRKNIPEKESREGYYGGEKYMTIAMDLMKQSVYATRYRLEDTRPYRVKFGGNPVYQIAILYGALLQLRLKLDNLFNTMYRFQYFVKFIWFLVIYERIITVNIDIQSMVDRIFAIQDAFRKGSESGEDDFFPTGDEHHITPK
ncbi:unnamed protein product [Colias eurytheme]|nr:unnamed protein product [Colias eurytheme]